MLFHNNYSILTRITYKKVNYLKAHKLLGYGVPEDVPVGYFLSLTTGYRKYEFSERPYVGLSASWTNISKKQGYYLTSIDYNGLPSNGKVYDNMVRARLIYFSPLFKLNQFEVRNILIPSFLSVNNPVYLNEINFGQEIRKLNQDKVYGYSTLTLKYESVLYMPYSYIGFKTAISVFADTGWIASEEYLQGKISYYGSYGLSIHIKNESLTIPTFSVQVAYFPRWKDETNKFIVSFSFSDLRFFKSFQSLKPSPYLLF